MTSFPLPVEVRLRDRSSAGNGVDVVAREAVFDVLGATKQCFLGGLGRNQRVAAVAEEVGALGLWEGFADFEVVFRIEELQQGLRPL
jgi:hypothetical protein